MRKIFINGNLLESNDEYFTLDFDYLAVVPSKIRRGEYSLVYQRGTETIELMLGVKQESEAKNVIKKLQQELAQLTDKEAQYSQTTEEFIVNYGNVIGLEKIQMPFKAPQTAVRFKSGHVAFITSSSAKINKIRTELERYKTGFKEQQNKISEDVAQFGE